MLRIDFFCLFALFIAFLSRATRVDPYTTDLKIERNDILKDGRKTEYIVYTSIAEYDQVTTDFTDQQLAGLAKQGTSLYLHSRTYREQAPGKYSI